MPESPLFDLPVSEAGIDACPRCGRLFEPAIDGVEVEGKPVRIRGHVQGDPVLCVPLPGSPSLTRDARARRAGRRAT